jgi:hypothetical protein
MVVEIVAIKKLFDVTRPIKIKKHTDWDGDFVLQTLDLELNTSETYPFWVISFRMYHGNVTSSDTFKLKVQYPSDYPDKEPPVSCVSHDTSGAPHRFQGGYFCLYTHGSGHGSGWDPAKSTAATVALWGAQWLRTWLYWKRHNNWPSHG